MKKHISDHADQIAERAHKYMLSHHPRYRDATALNRFNILKRQVLTSPAGKFRFSLANRVILVRAIKKVIWPGAGE